MITPPFERRVLLMEVGAWSNGTTRIGTLPIGINLRELLVCDPPWIESLDVWKRRVHLGTFAEFLG